MARTRQLRTQIHAPPRCPGGRNERTCQDSPKHSVLPPLPLGNSRIPPGSQPQLLPIRGPRPCPSNPQPSCCQDSHPPAVMTSAPLLGGNHDPDLQDFILPWARTSIPPISGPSPTPEGTLPSRGPWLGRRAPCSAVRALTGGSCGCVTGSWLPGNPRRLITAATVINQK